MSIPIRIGDPAPDFRLLATTGKEVSLRDYYGEPVLLVFMEQLGSLFGREHLAALGRRGAELESIPAAVLVVSFAPPERLQSFVGEVALPFCCLSDPGLTAYQAYGLEPADAECQVTSRTMLALLKLLIQGRRLPHTEGDPLQLGGDFVVGRDGRLRLTHRMAEPMDRPRLPELLGLLRQVALVGRLE